MDNEKSTKPYVQMPKHKLAIVIEKVAEKIPIENASFTINGNLFFHFEDKKDTSNGNTH